MCLTCLIFMQSCFYDYQTFRTFSLRDLGFLLCSHDLDVPRAQRIIGFVLAKLPRNQWGREIRSHGEVQGNKCWQLAHLSYPKACYRILKYSIQNPTVKLFPLPIREFQGLCNWTTMLHVQQATSLPPNFSIKKVTMDRSWFAIYLLLLKFLLHVCSLLFCICANEKTVIMTKMTT